MLALQKLECITMLKQFDVILNDGFLVLSDQKISLCVFLHGVLKMEVQFQGKKKKTKKPAFS